MNIQKKLLTVNFSTAKNQKLGICIHTMVGTLEGTNSHFNNPASEVSSHYGVDLAVDKIYQWVEEDHTAWAQGVVSGPTNKLVLDKGGNPNSYFISIECADGAKPADADRSKQKRWLSELVADIAKRNNIPLDRDHVCGHKEIYNKKTCPGNISVDEILELAKQIVGEECLKLNEDIPTFVEDKYDLKSKEWYSKYWKLDEFIKDSITTHIAYKSLVDKHKELERKNEFNEKIIEQDVELFKAKDKQISTLQEGNTELTEQLRVAGDQVKSAVKEKTDAVKAQGIAETNEGLAVTAKEQAETKVKELELKLVQGLKGYSRFQLIRAYFGFY